MKRYFCNKKSSAKDGSLVGCKKVNREAVFIDGTRWECIVPAVMLGMTVLSGVALASSSVSADSDYYITTAAVTVPVSCRLEGNVDTAHNATLPNGIYSVTYNDGSSTPYANGIGQTTLKAYCNDNNGFAIYAIGYSDEEYGNTDLIATVGGTLSPSNNIHTGTYTGSSTSDPSAWAMKLNKVAGDYAPIIVGTTEDTEKEQSTPNYSTYQSVPANFTRVAYRNSATDIGEHPTGSSLTTTYAAYISPAQAAGTYTGKVLYRIVHPYNADAPTQPQATEAGCIRYYPNGGNVVGTMGCQPITDSDTSVTLLASNFSRDGYGFAGWSDANDYATNSNANFYGPQEDITFTAGQYTGTNPGLSLYAVWVKSVGSLQDATTVASICNNLTQSGSNITKTLNSVSALTDQRDNQTYAIAKLADGNCWMIENLRLEAENSANESLAQGFGKSTTYGNFEGLATAESENFANTNTVANSKYSADGSNDTISIGSFYAYARIPRYNNLNTKNRATNPTTNVPDSAVGIYSYGNYYTWSAAMANTGLYNSDNADVNGYTPSEAASTSICPKGWQLPYGRSIGKGATSGGFSYLDVQLGGTGANSTSSTTPTSADMYKIYRAYPNNFVASGYFYTSSANNRGSNGYYWSSTADVIASASFYLGLNSSTVYPGTNVYSRSGGYSIRCVVGSGA